MLKSTQHDFHFSHRNIMKLTDGLFLKVATDVAKDYPHIEFNNMIVDNWYALFLLHLLSFRDNLL